MNAEPEIRTFGQALGRLIKQKRQAAALTQLQLSEDAFGTHSKVRRISELESGLVANPHARTINPVINVLGISDEELAACATETAWTPDPDFERAYREARNLIEAAAARFDHARPDASLAELEDYLKSKALEWRELRDRIAEFETADKAHVDLLDRAVVALGDGDLAAVDALLAEAEEIQQRERTIVEISKQAQIRVLRADACLVGDDGDRAFELYLGAARFFDPFDTDLAVDMLMQLAGRVYETGRRSLVQHFDVARRLLDALAEHPAVRDDAVELGIANYRRALIYNREAVSRPGQPFDEGLLKQALDFSIAAVGGIMPADDPDFAVCARIQLGNIHMSLARVEPDAGHLTAAETALRAALVMAEEDEPRLVPDVRNSLGALCMDMLRKGEGAECATMLDRALDHFTCAMERAEQLDKVEIWGNARINRGHVLAAIAAGMEDNPRRRSFLRIRAAAEYDAAIETYPATLFPDRFAEANCGLAYVLAAQALDGPGLLADDYLFRAISRLETAAHHYRRDIHTRQWADIHVQAGTLFIERARRAIDGDVRSQHSEQARICFDGAADAYSTIGDSEKAAACRETAQEVEDKVRYQPKEA